MEDNFLENSYREVMTEGKLITGNIVKKEDVDFMGSTRVEFHEDMDDGVKILFKKDENDQVKEIKFVCSCGETKSVIMDYNE